MIRDLAEVLRDEVELLVSEGASYIQLDAPSYMIHLMDALGRPRLTQLGIDPNEVLDQTIAGDNAVVSGILGKEGVTIGMHLCRGNNRSAWAAEGSYEPIAEKIFGSLHVDTFLLEYDSDRSGGFEPLRFMPRNKKVVLGLITTKEPTLESEDVLRRRIDEAARYIDVDNLAISTQCGFASTAYGNLVSWDDQRRKLELVVKAARWVWGE